MEQLRQHLRAIDGKGYKAYKQIKGHYDLPDYTLSIDHVQGDPYAAASRISIRLTSATTAYPPALSSNKTRKIAFEDFLGRQVAKAIIKHCKGQRGTGKGGEISIARYGQQVLQRNAVLLEPDFVEIRLTPGLPGSGRSILGKDAESMFFTELPAIVNAALIFTNLDSKEAQRHVDSVEDQEALRAWLTEQKLVAFVANDSLLPRLTGIDDRPLDKDAHRFTSPVSLERSVTLPNAGEIKGTGIPQGVTLIVGGGFHGKSTLLHALERGVYNHIPDDGREQVVTDASAVKVRAEDGRAISNVNISPFISNLPFGRDTVNFSTENASGSTSQAANIIEALECESRVLLIDEDTSATNFMIRDERMQALVADDKEPITPFLHRVRELYKQRGISTVIVMGGSGDYFDVADTVIMMDNYQPNDVTVEAKKLAHDSEINISNQTPFNFKSTRKPDKRTLDPSRNHHAVKIDCKDTDMLFYGEHRIDLDSIEQLIDPGQLKSIGLMIHYYNQHSHDNTDNLIEGLKKTLEDANVKGLDAFSQYKVGNLALPRLFELAATVNRIRGEN